MMSYKRTSSAYGIPTSESMVPQGQAPVQARGQHGRKMHVERLMHSIGLKGVIRSKVMRTTILEDKDQHSLDLAH
jgi:hypothetical protein